MVADMEYIIGRDPEVCQIVIEQNLGRVSRRHCGILYSPSKQTFYVCDYSSNGTFLDDGTRLQNGVYSAINYGATILLGNADVSFRLE
jgi:predicted component of type VI protein secretion system